MEEDRLEMQQMPQDALAEAGRGTDKVMAHMSLGEIVIPRAFQDDPEVMAVLQQIFEVGGADINEFTVGHEANKINPETGYPEFGFGRFLRRVAGAVLPNLGAAGGFANGLIQGDGLGGALKQGLTSGIQTAATIYGGPLAGAAAGGINAKLNGGNPLTGAIGGGIGGLFTGGSDVLSGALKGFGNSTGLSSLYNTASGALSNVTGGIGDQINNAYNGSVLQDVFKSGGEVLNAAGLGTSPDAVGQGIGATGGGGTSAYGNGTQLPWLAESATTPAEQGLLSNANSVLTKAAPTATTGASEMASQNYASPIVSALLGSYTNNKAEEQLLAQQRANQSLLAPYQNFQFNPQDLQNDPGYQFNLAQGNQALDRQQLAKGGFFSGQALKEAQNFGQGLADNTYNTAFNRALQTNQEGLRGAGAMANVNDNIGNIRAGSTVNSGNLYSGALGSILGGDSFTNSGALQGGSGGDYLSNLLRQLELKRMMAA